MRQSRASGALAGVLLFAAAALGPEPPGRAAPAAQEHVYVTVTDGKNQPVAGLTAADFAVQIDGADQEVLAAEPAKEPMSVVLLTDRLGLGSTYTAFDLRQILGDYVASIRTSRPESKFSLMTFDGTVLQLTKFTSAPADLDRSLGRLAGVVEDAVLLDALAEACRALRSAPTPRRFIFTILAAYRPDQSNERNDVVGELLRLSKASLWAIEVRQAQGGNFANPAREQVLDAGSQLTGGLRETVNSRSGLAAAAKRMGDLVTAQYAVTYAPGGGTARSTFNVGVRRAGVRIYAPRWLAR
jgi:hypothetical protein